MRLLTLAIFAATAFSTAAIAENHGGDHMITMDTVLGTTMDEVRATLTGMGYEVRKFEMEADKMEVYFVGNGKMGEVYVSPETGKPTKIEME